MNNISHLIKNDHFQLAILQNANFELVQFPQSLSEINRLNSKINESAKNQTLASHYLVKSILGNDCAIEYDHHGRPYIQNSSWDFSIAHAESVTAIAMTRQPNRVGLDVENLHQNFDHNLFIRQAFLPEEKSTLQVIQQAWNLNEKNSVLALWSLKESFFKARGGEFTPKNIGIRAEKNNSRLFDISENKGSGFVPIPIQEVSLQIDQDYLLSFCVLESISK